MAWANVPTRAKSLGSRPRPTPKGSSLKKASLNLFRLPDALSTRLWNCASKCVGFSIRELAQFHRHAVYLNRTQYTFGEALKALEKMVGKSDK
jgi:hypothetical protein